MQLWAALGRGNYSCQLINCHLCPLFRLAPSWTDCQTCFPFREESFRSVRGGSQDLYAQTTTTNYQGFPAPSRPFVLELTSCSQGTDVECGIKLPDLSPLQRQVIPFYPRQWPGSICVVDHHHKLQRLSSPIQALCPRDDQLKPGNRHRMRDLTDRLISPSETSHPVLSAAVARIYMRSRPPPQINKAFPPHAGPLPTSYSELVASSMQLFSMQSCIVVAVVLWSSLFFIQRENVGSIVECTMALQSASCLCQRPRLCRARKLTASNSCQCYNFRRSNWQEWADGRPSCWSLCPCSPEGLLRALDNDAVIYYYERQAYIQGYNCSWLQQYIFIH